MCRLPRRPDFRGVAMSHRCGKNCLRKQGVPGLRCQTCKDSRHPNREANRLSTIIYIGKNGETPPAVNTAPARRVGRLTIDNFRRKPRCGHCDRPMPADAVGLLCRICRANARRAENDATPEI